MDLKKVESKNPGWNFSEKVSKKASKAVLDSATKSNLDIESYNLKYAASKKKRPLKDTIEVKKQNDRNWKMLNKTSKEKLTDAPEESKAGFYDEEGNEVASQG